jgi:hypothetical protein
MLFIKLMLNRPNQFIVLHKDSVFKKENISTVKLPTCSRTILVASPQVHGPREYSNEKRKMGNRASVSITEDSIS